MCHGEPVEPRLSEARRRRAKSKAEDHGTMHSFRIVTVAAALLLLAASPSPAPATTAIAAILANPTSFDGQHLSVNGTVGQLAEKTSRRGNNYTTFDLCDTACIHVYSYGHPKIANGQPLTVSGKFFADKHVGSLEFKNELDADEGSL